ncbi:MAG: hypothetical protein L3J84_03050 [Gammaproteobacteria bacterium]|nr:hypothetical protein [Gammaproteobacteria bacterium]
MIRPYDDKVEDQMIMFYDSLSEKDKRRYAAIEVLKLPYGGRSYIHTILNCSYPAIDSGISEHKCDELSDSEVARTSGGGRKSSIESIVGIDISKPIVKKLFKRHGYVKRKALKSIKLGSTENRNKQF